MKKRMVSVFLTSLCLNAAMGAEVGGVKATLHDPWDGKADVVYEAGCGIAYYRASLPKGGLYTFAVPEGVRCQVWTEDGLSSVARQAVYSGFRFFTVDTTRQKAATADCYVQIEGSVGQMTSLYTVEGDYLAEVATFKLFFNPQGGTCGETARRVTCGDEIGKLPVPVRNGWKFDGWYTAATGGVKVGPATLMVGFDVDLYAHWQYLR